MGEIRTFLILLCCCRVLSLLTSVVIMKLVVLVLLCGLACHHVDAEGETLDIPTDQEGPLVIDPEVAEQMAKERVRKEIFSSSITQVGWPKVVRSLTLQWTFA